MSTNGHVDLGQVPIEQRVRAVRKARGWTQIKFADEVGVTVRQVKRWEAGAIPSEDFAHEIARVAPRALRAKPEMFFEPKERREERLLELEKRLSGLERRMRRAGL